MGIERSVHVQAVGLADAHQARVASGGLAAHPHLAALVDGSGIHAGRDLADAIHLLCHLHGRHPGLIAIALTANACAEAAEWLDQAAVGFESERLLLVRLTSAVGPLPSTPGAAETEASLAAQRHALETLARSERRGCAIGAAAALAGDWAAIRALLDRAASRTGIDVPSAWLPDQASVADVIARCATTPASERALSFGAEQLLLQHRALFDLLEARAEARGDY